MRIDAHQHFWRYTPEEFDWLDDAKASLRRDFLPSMLAPLLAAHGIDGTVAVQARQSLDETRWLLELAQAHPFIKGVVGWVPLADPRIGHKLDALKPFAQLKGVRHVVQSEPDPAFLDGPAFNAGLRAVTSRALTYDLLLVEHQLPACIRFVDRHPRQTFILDHIAKPTVRGAPSAEWRDRIRELARRGHVACKFSGVVTEVSGGRWTPALLRPYFDVVLDAFGPRRLMFGSDWPVCLAAADYAAWVSFVRSCTDALSADECARIWGGTASEVYRL